MMYRPNVMRSAGLSGFCLVIGLVPALAGGTPLAVRIVGWAMVFAVAGFVVVACRTWVRIGDGLVEVGGVRGTRLFRAGDASVRRFSVPGGPVRDGAALHVEGGGSSATVALSMFRPADREQIVRQVRAALRAS